MLSPRTTTSCSPRREVLGHPDDLRDAAGLRLHLVGEVELEQRRVAAARGQVAVAEEVDHLARVPLAGDDEHLADAGELEQLQRVVDHRPAADRQQVLVRDTRQLAEPRRLSSCADQSLHGADANRDQAACDRFGAGSANGLRSRPQNESSTAGPIPNAKASVPMPTVPPSAKPITVTSDLDRRACDTDPDAGASGRDEHQRVARAGAHPGADVEAGADPDHEHARDHEDDPGRERRVRQGVDRVDREQPVDHEPDEDGVRDRSRPDAGAERPGDDEHDQRDDDVRRPERERRVLGDALVEHVPRREPELRLEQEHDAEPRRGRARRRARRP